MDLMRLHAASHRIISFGFLTATVLTTLTSLPTSAQTPAPAAGPAQPGSPTAPGATPPIGPSPTPAPEGLSAPSPEADAAATAAPAEPAADAAPSGPPAEIQDPPLDVAFELQSIRDDHQGLQTDVENFKFQWQRERDLHTAITTRGLLIGGTIQARVGWIDQDQGGPNGAAVSIPTGTSYGRRSSFDISTAALSFTGSLYRDYEEGRNLTYNLRFGASPQTTPVTNSNYVNLLDANIVYSILPTVDRETPLLTVTLGQQLLPFGLEAAATEELKPVIRNALFTNASYAPGARNAATGLGLGRETGLIVRGDLFPQIDFGYNYRQALIAYTFGIMNGNGINTPDDNDDKDFIGRIAVTIPSDYNSWLRQLTFGGTAYWGRRNLYLADEARTLSGVGRKERYGFDIYYNHWPLGATYEFVVGKDTTTFGTTLADSKRADITSIAHTATFFFSFGQQFVAGFRNQSRFDDWWPKTWQPFARYDRFERNTSVAGKERVEVVTLGLNIFFAETTKFQFNYNWRRDNRVIVDPKALPDLRHPSHELLAQFQYGF
ncbi:MAG: porin [Polyangiales bacterium]